MRTWREVDARALVHPRDHTLGTAWEGLGGLAQEFPTAAPGTRCVPVGQEAVLPKTPAATGEHMQQEAADTCVGIERHGLDTLALTTVAGGKADAAVTPVEAPVVRAGDARRRAADIIQALRRAGTGRLGVDDPLVRVELSAKLCKALREEHGAGGACRGQRRAELAAQDRAQGPPRAEEAGISRAPALPGGGPRASRDDAVDVAVRPQGLLPGVPPPRAPALPAEVAVSNLPARLTRRVEPEGQQRSCVHADAGIEGMGHGQDQVARGHRPQLGLARLDPLGLGKGLTRWPVTIPTGILGIPLESTGGTVFGVPTELRRSAGLDRVPHLLRHGRHGVGTAGGLPREAEDIGACPR